MTMRYVAVGVESAYGTPVDTTVCRMTQVSDPVNRNPAVEESLDSTSASAIYGGIYKVSGTFEGLFRPTAMADLFHGLTGDATSPYELQDNPKPLTIQIGDDQAGGTGYKTTYSGCGLTRCEITCAVKEFVRTRWTWIGAAGNPVTAAASSRTYGGSDTPSVFYNAVFQIASADVPAKSATVVIERRMDEDYYYIGSQFLKGLYLNGLSDVNGVLTFGAGEWGYIEDVINSPTGTNALSGGALDMTFKTPDNVSQNGAINIADVRMTEMNRSVTGRNQWEKTANYRAVITQPSDFSVTLGA